MVSADHGVYNNPTSPVENPLFIISCLALVASDISYQIIDPEDPPNQTEFFYPQFLGFLRIWSPPPRKFHKDMSGSFGSYDERTFPRGSGNGYTDSRTINVQDVVDDLARHMAAGKVSRGSGAISPHHSYESCRECVRVHSNPQRDPGLNAVAEYVRRLVVEDIINKVSRSKIPNTPGTIVKLTRSTAPFPRKQCGVKSIRK